MYNIAIPASVTWLQTADPEDVRFEHFIQVCRDYIEYQRVCGVPEERFQIPEQFVQEGDLQSFMNVVSWWPKDAPRGYHAPTLSGLMQSVIMVDASRPSTFLSTLENAKARIEPWLKLHKHSQVRRRMPANFLLFWTRLLVVNIDQRSINNCITFLPK